MNQRELDELMFCDWPRVVQRALRDGDAWAKGFALSIRKQAKKPDWRPSPKQAALMRRMVAEVRQSPAGDIGDLVE